MEERSLKWFDDDIPSQLASSLLDKLGFKPNSDLIDITVKGFENYMVAYNRYHYAHSETKFCVLCGNGGVIDTTKTAVSPNGISTGGKHWCMCPNGVIHRLCEYEGELEGPDS